MRRTRRRLLCTTTGIAGLTVTAGAASTGSHASPDSNLDCPRTGSDDATESVDETDEPRSQTLSATVSAIETSVEPGTEIEFDASGSTGDIDAYAWTFGDGTEPTMTADDSVGHAYEEPGEYTALLAVRDTTGELEGDSVTITVTDDREASDDRSYEERVEAAIHDEVNEVRARNGLNRLEFDERVAEIARGHSRDMAENDFLGHESSDGRSLRDRYQDAGVTCEVYAENVLYRPADDDPTATATACVDNWMDNSGHRDHILDERWEGEGIGVAVDDADRLYATQNFDDGCN